MGRRGIGERIVTTQHKPKLIENTGSRIVTLFMIVTSWLSFVASLWLAMFLTSNFLFLGAFWLVVTILLAAILGASKKV